MLELANPWVCTRCSRSFARRTKLITRVPLQRRGYSVQPVVKSNDRPFRMAVIGSGPAGFYTSYRVMSKIQDSVVDMYEHLPVPYGLVRFGVAPDHPDVKKCQTKFEEVAESPNFNFIGNISIGSGLFGSLSLEALLPHYDAICFAYGASKDRSLGIPGEDKLRGIYSARAFVGWYNGLPEYADLKPDLAKGEEAVIIGQGNVALDVARILLEDPYHLGKTDITEDALHILRQSKVKRVRIVGRRGPRQAAFTIKELRELINLPFVGMYPADKSLLPADLNEVPRPGRRILELMLKGSVVSAEDAPKSWSLDYCLSPRSFNKDSKISNALGSMTFEKTTLSPNSFEREAKAIDTGATVKFPASLAFRSIGYKSEPLQGFEQLNIPFDDRSGVISNDGKGRIMKIDQQGTITTPKVGGLYCAGWVKNGPTGVIASTMTDAFQTAEAIAEDWSKPRRSPYRRFLADILKGGTTGLGWEGVRKEAKLSGCRRVSWEDWKKIDAAERRRGRMNGKEREKFTSLDAMLAVLD